MCLVRPTVIYIYSMAFHVNTVHSHPQRLLPFRILQVRGQERPLLPAEGDVCKGQGHSELACCGAYMKVNLQAQAGVGSMTEAADMGSRLPSWRAARTAARIWCLRDARRDAGVRTEDGRSA